MGNKKRKRKEASLAGSTPSAPTDSLKQQKESLLDKFRDNLIAQVVALVVSILTVGSCTYLLFDYRADRLKSEREVLRFDTLTQEDKWANDISQTYRTGVTANKDQTQKIVDAVRYLSNNVRIEKLDDRFPNDTLEWVIHSISQVVEEEGHVSGYTLAANYTRMLSKISSECTMQKSVYIMR